MFCINAYSNCFFLIITTLQRQLLDYGYTKIGIRLKINSKEPSCSCRDQGWSRGQQLGCCRFRPCCRYQLRCRYQQSCLRVSNALMRWRMKVSPFPLSLLPLMVPASLPLPLSLGLAFPFPLPEMTGDPLPSKVGLPLPDTDH